MRTMLPCLCVNTLEYRVVDARHTLYVCMYFAGDKGREKGTTDRDSLVDMTIISKSGRRSKHKATPIDEVRVHKTLFAVCRRG